MTCKWYVSKAVSSRGGRNWAGEGQRGKEDFILYIFLYFLGFQWVTTVYSKNKLKIQKDQTQLEGTLTLPSFGERTERVLPPTPAHCEVMAGGGQWVRLDRAALESFQDIFMVWRPPSCGT